MRTIYLFMLVMLGLRCVEYSTALAPTPRAIIMIVLSVGMYSLVFAWWRVARSKGDIQ